MGWLITATCRIHFSLLFFSVLMIVIATATTVSANMPSKVAKKIVNNNSQIYIILK